VDTAEVLRQALADFGVEGALSGKVEPVTVLFYPAPSSGTPYTQDRGHAGPRVRLLSAEAEGVDLSATVLTVAGDAYRVVRSSDRLGGLTLYLRED
jgi:hypothetical protein